MTVAITSGPVVPKRLRIAITSPDILAQIQHVFASKNLALEINGLPYVEVTVRPAANVAIADRSAVGSAVQRLVGPGTRSGGTEPRRLCAEYRLDVVEVGDGLSGDGPRAEPMAPTARRHLAVVPEPDADPVPALSPRQREVMGMVSRGARNPEIAATLRVSEKTVKNHINRIFRALGASSRVEAVLIWQRHNPGATRRDASRPAVDRRPGRAGTP
jgi:DNA-binding CsgD family transcriptional regulator